MTFPTPLALLGVNLLYVSFVLFIVALYLQERVGPKETAAMCILTGGLSTSIALYTGFILGDVAGMGGSLLFGFTYLYLAFNILTGADTRSGIGHYALAVSLTTLFFIAQSVADGDLLFVFLWALWGQLWFCFYLLNALQRPIVRFVAWNTHLVAFVNFLAAIVFMFGWL